MFSSRKYIIFLHLDSKKLTEKPDPSATESFKTADIRTTHHLQTIDFITEIATSSGMSNSLNRTLHSTTSVTTTNSTRNSASSSVTQSHTPSVSLIKTYATKSSPINLTRAATPLFPNATHYKLTLVNPLNSKSPPSSLRTEMFIGKTTTPIQFTSAHSPPRSNSASIKPTFFNTIIQTKTSVHLIGGKTHTTPCIFCNITSKPTKTSVHIIAAHTETPTPSTRAHISTPSTSVSFTISRKSYYYLFTTYTNSTISPITTTSRIPLTPLLTSVVTRKAASTFSFTQRKIPIPSAVLRNNTWPPTTTSATPFYSRYTFTTTTAPASTVNLTDNSSTSPKPITSDYILDTSTTS